MVYTVGEMARLLHVPASTLRYYDKEGLLPFVERSSGGIRMFKDSDYEWLQVIGCLKKAGMSIRDIRQYILLAMQGDSTIGDRLQMFYAQRERLLEQMEQLRQTLDTLNYKCWFYEQAKACGLDGGRGPASCRKNTGARSAVFAMCRFPERSTDCRDKNARRTSKSFANVA